MSSTTATAHDVDALARALYSLSALRRDLQRCAGIEHAVAALAMLAVVRRIGPARISDLAHEAQVDLSVASRQVHALEADAHVVRVPDPNDGRSSLIAISGAGDEKLDRAHGRLTDALAAATGDWAHDDVVGLADGLVRLHAALGTCASPAAVTVGEAAASPAVAASEAQTVAADPALEADPSAAAPATPGDPSAADPALPTGPSLASPALPAEPSSAEPSSVDASSVDASSVDASSAEPYSADPSAAEPARPTGPSPAGPTLPADPSAAGPTLTPAPAGQHHEEHTR